MFDITKVNHEINYIWAFQVFGVYRQTNGRELQFLCLHPKFMIHCASRGLIRGMDPFWGCDATCGWDLIWRCDPIWGLNPI